MTFRRRLVCGLSCLAIGLGAACENDSGDSSGGGDTAGGLEGECTQFCTDVVAACPEDDTLPTCVQSCVEADKIPDQAALDCAAAATSCDDTHACWPMLYDAAP